MLLEQVDDKGYAGNVSLPEEGVKAKGVTLRDRGVCVGDETSLLEIDDV